MAWHYTGLSQDEMAGYGIMLQMLREGLHGIEGLGLLLGSTLYQALHFLLLTFRLHLYSLWHGFLSSAVGWSLLDISARQIPSIILKLPFAKFFACFQFA
jgi:hypothetical protein